MRCVRCSIDTEQHEILCARSQFAIARDWRKAPVQSETRLGGGAAHCSLLVFGGAVDGGLGMMSFRLDDSGAAPLTVLCIGAHCDDIEIGCGGFLAELCGALRRVDIAWFIAAANDERASESRRAATRLLKGARAYHVEVHDFPDGELPYAGPELRRSLRAFGDRHSANLILTHSRDDAHQDHQFLAELTWQTFRNHLILEYEIPKYDGDLGRPNWFVPLDPTVVDLKVECLLDCFASQRTKPWFHGETFRGLMRLRGSECRSPSGYAEAFHLRKGLLHLPTNAPFPSAGDLNSTATSHE